MNRGVNALPIIGGFYIKDNKLLEMTSYAFASSKDTAVNIYIDLNSVFKKLLSASFNMNARLGDYEIASGVLNMIAHYRYFFWSRLRVTTNFYFVYSLLNNISTKAYFGMITDFEASGMAHKDAYNLIIKNVSLLEKIIPYIPDSCITVGTVEPCVIMKHIMLTNNSPLPNILLTKDEVTMQLAAMMPNTVIYVPKKYKGEDSSYAIIPDNNGLYNAYSIYKRKCKPYPFKCVVSSQLYSLLLCMIGVKSRNIYCTIHYVYAMSILEELILSHKINNGYIPNVNDFLNSLSDSELRRTFHNNKIEGIFKTLDMEFQYGIYLNNPERLYYKGIQNLYDPVGVHEICNEYFKECPINLERM